jgi:aspartate racemase
MKKESKTAGILGGMGPYASASFYETILNLTPAEKDWDHLHLIIDNNPHIPGRSRHHLFGEASPVPGMIESCKKLENYPVDFIVIPCNSASYYLPEIQQSIKIPIINIMEITVNSMIDTIPRNSSVAVLGGIITYDKRTYEPFLQKNGFSYAHHSSSVQRKVEQLIEKIKINCAADEVLADFTDLIGFIKEDVTVDAVILGCTELGLVTNCQCAVKIVDSSRELALETIRYATA